MTITPCHPPSTGRPRGRWPRRSDARRSAEAASCHPSGAPTVTSDLSEERDLTSLDDLHNLGLAEAGSGPCFTARAGFAFIEFAALLRFPLSIPDPLRLDAPLQPRQADSADPPLALVTMEDWPPGSGPASTKQIA